MEKNCNQKYNRIYFVALKMDKNKRNSENKIFKKFLKIFDQKIFISCVGNVVYFEVFEFERRFERKQ